MFLLSIDDFFQIQPIRKIILGINIFDADEARRFVRPDLDPNCLQRLSADDSSRQRVKHTIVTKKCV